MMLGLGQAPNCFAGETLQVSATGEYTCVPTINAQTLGAQQPACQYGQAFIDPTTEDWACPAPPVQQSVGGIGAFVVAALIAVVVWQFYASTTAKTVSKVSKGDFDDFLPGWATKVRDAK